jgi:hypothetical protein
MLWGIGETWAAGAQAPGQEKAIRGVGVPFKEYLGQEGAVVLFPWPGEARSPHRCRLIVQMRD